jgi:D-3-phosphoglycerate dehydrogenase
LDDIGQVTRASAFVQDSNGISAGELIKIMPEYDAIILRGRTKLTVEVIQAGKRLKVIGRAGVGVDNIELSAAKNQNIIVVNAPLSTSTAVAELTIGLLLALAREIPRADLSMKNGQWIKRAVGGNYG